MRSTEKTRLVLTTFLLFLLILFTISILNAQDCEIDKFKAKHTHCQNDHFIARIWFDYENTSDQFHLYVNGADSGLFYYEDLPLWIGPLPADGLTPYAFAVEDAENAGCGYLYTMDPVLCDDEECEIEDFELEVQDCEDSQFYAMIDLEYENTSDAFRLWVNGVDNGFYSYTDLPVYIGPLQADGQTPYAFWAEDAETAGCGYLYTLYPFTCEEEIEECSIDDFEAEAKFCEEGLFYAKINFEYENTGDQFHLYVNGADSGLYSYDQLPVYLGPLDADGVTPYAFWAEDAETAGCGYLYTMDPVECGNPNPHECELRDLSVKVRDCDEGEFYAKINVKRQFTSDQFHLWVNDADSGYYAYHDLPIYVGPLPADGITPYAFMVEDADIADCQCMFTLDPVECQPGGDNANLIENIYPIPASTRLEVKFKDATADKPVTIEILDMNGLLYHYEKSEGKLNATIDIGSLEQGIYFIRVIESSTTVEVRKFIIR